MKSNSINSADGGIIEKPFNIALFFSLGVAAILRIPSIFWPPISDDEALYHTWAQMVNSGGIMYRDFLDHKPPGLVYFYALVERIAGHVHEPYAASGIVAVHFAGILIALLTCYGLFLIAAEFHPKREAWVAPLLYGLVSAAKPSFDGMAVNGELLMNVATAFAIVMALSARKRNGFSAFIFDLSAGLFLGIAGLFKWQALIAGVAFPLFKLNGPLFKTKSWAVSFRVLAWILGMSFPILMTGFYFYLRGNLSEAWHWGGLFNLRYIAEGPGFLWALKRLGTQLLSTILPSLLVYCAGIFALGRTIRGNQFTDKGIMAWSIVSLLAVGIGGRFFGHYFLQFELPLCLLAAAPVMQFFYRFPKGAIAALGLPATAFFVLNLSPEIANPVFDPGEPEWEKIGQAISEKTRPDETLFVWGNAPYLYPYSRRMPGTRFIFCNYLTGLSPGTASEYDPSTIPVQTSSAWPLLFEDLRKRRPSVILDTAFAGWKGYAKFPIKNFPKLNAYLAEHYRVADVVEDGAVLYRRID